MAFLGVNEFQLAAPKGLAGGGGLLGHWSVEIVSLDHVRVSAAVRDEGINLGERTEYTNMRRFEFPDDLADMANGIKLLRSA